VEHARRLNHSSNSFDRRHPQSPKETIVDVLTLIQNETMERFAVLRQAFAHKVKPSPASQAEVSGQVPDDRAADGDSGSRLGAVLVLLIPVAGLAWAGIGWLLYRLVG
jgi:hypothetical protein